MSESAISDVRKKLGDLQLSFKNNLPDKIAEIETLYSSLTTPTLNADKLSDLHRRVHGLAGSGGTFGAIAVSHVSRQLEQILKSLAKEAVPSPASLESHLPAINELIIRLKKTSEEWQPTDIPYIESLVSNPVADNNLIYLTEDDKLLAQDLIENL